MFHGELVTHTVGEELVWGICRADFITILCT